MRCVYCEKIVFGNNCLTVPRLGPAHMQCFQANQALRRTFQNLDITALDDEELKDLRDLVLAETNARSRASNSSGIDLF